MRVSLEGVIKVLTNRGNGSFLPSIAVRVGNYPVASASGDLNRDGKLDLGVANASFQPNLEVLFNTTSEP